MVPIHVAGVKANSQSLRTMFSVKLKCLPLKTTGEHDWIHRSISYGAYEKTASVA